MAVQRHNTSNPPFACGSLGLFSDRRLVVADSPVKDFVVINDRWGNTTRTHHGGTFLCEYDPTCKFDHPFAVTQGFGKSFGFNRLEEVGPIDHNQTD